MRDVNSPRLWLLAESLVVMTLARVALRVLPARKILAWQTKPVRATGSEADMARHRQRVAWAVDVVAKRGPVAFVCFPRCLAVSYLLRARGVATRLHYGAAREGGQLVTHTWLESGGEVLVGGEVKADYSTLAVY